MSSEPPQPKPIDQLIEELIAAANAFDTERTDKLLDHLRLWADYEELVEELTSSVDACNEQRAEEALEKLRSFPSLEEFALLRSITN
jgi:hypothetical protein